MSSEQQERQAMQYVERSSLLTVRTLLKLLEWSARQALAQDSAYKIGVQKMEEVLTPLKRLMLVKTYWISQSMWRNLRS